MKPNENDFNKAMQFLAYVNALQNAIKKAMETHKGIETLETKRVKFTYIIN